MYENFESSADDFLDKSILLMGGSDTGKTTIIRHIAYDIREDITSVIVFCPTNSVHHTYDKIATLPCIHSDINVDVLNDMFDRQAVHKSTHDAANQPELIDALFEHLNPTRLKNYIKKIRLYAEKKAERARRNDRQDDADTILAECEATIEKIKKSHIAKHRAALLENRDLTPEESKAAKFFDLTYRIVVIFDDCSDQLQPLKSNPIIKKFFNQGRHNGMTIIIACHSHATLLPEQKNGAAMTFVTESKIARALFSDPKSFDRTSRKQALEATAAILENPTAKWDKLMYRRGHTGKFYRFQADPSRKDFSAQHPIVAEFCELISVDPNAPISSKFAFDSSRRR